MPSMRQLTSACCSLAVARSSGKSLTDTSWRLQQSEEFRAQLEARVTPELGKMQVEMQASLLKVDVAFTELSATVQSKVDAMNKAYTDLEQRIGHSAETIDQMRAAGDEAFNKLQALQSTTTAESAKQTVDVADRLQEVQKAMADAVASVATVREEAQRVRR